MKKIIALLLVMCCFMTLFACKNESDGNGNQDTPSADRTASGENNAIGGGVSAPVKQDTSSSNKIVFGEKYISEDSVSRPEDQQTYYIFEDGLLKRHYYSEVDTLGGSKISHYTRTYKYEIMDDGTLAYFFHSMTLHDDDTYNEARTKDNVNGILLFSENVLSSPEGYLYIRESYIKSELPNFGEAE